jgi:hypothetical protein
MEGEKKKKTSILEVINCRRLVITDLLSAVDSLDDRALIRKKMFLPSDAVKNYRDRTDDADHWLGKMDEISRFICEKIMAVHVRLIDRAARAMLNQQADLAEFQKSPDVKALFAEIAGKKAELEAPPTPPAGVEPITAASEGGGAAASGSGDAVCVVEEEQELTQEEAVATLVTKWKKYVRNMWNAFITFKIVPC